MAIIKYKVIEITKKFDGNNCEVLAEVISVHNNFINGFFTFSAQKNLKKMKNFNKQKK